MARYIDLVFSGPPSHRMPKLIEVENRQGRSITCGEWVDRGDGTWALRISEEDVAKARRRTKNAPAKKPTRKAS